jgi:hypothetical protein
MKQIEDTKTQDLFGDAPEQEAPKQEAPVYENYCLDDFYNECCTFNALAGKDSKTSKEDFVKQLGYLEEEVLEIGTGLADEDYVEVLDGVIDVLVVSLGMLRKLQVKGYDIQKALHLISNNNLSKLVHQDDVLTHQRTLEIYGDTIRTYKHEGATYYAYLRNGDDKIMKPAGFEAVDLKGCL